jgi:hypothetical protein
MTQLLPTLLIIIDLGAALVYAVVDADIRRVVYWTAAAILTASVTF